MLQWPKLLNAPLSEVDPELLDIIEHEKNRQWKVRCLLSHNITSSFSRLKLANLLDVQAS
jgi:glycine hydroxymethyltransferase